VVSAIASKLRSHWIEIAWGVFAAANVAVILVLGQWETIPFHFVWVSLTILYGFRVWRLRSTTILLVIVCLVTGAALAFSITRWHERPDEISEVPLMAAMFVAMVWHARRRQAAMEEARRRAESEHRVLEGQREFVRDASHELRTPITVARGHAELIRSSTGDPQVAADADVVLDELRRLARISERLLLLAGAGHPGFLTTTVVPIEPLVVGMLRRWSPTAARRWRVDVEVEGTVLADRERLEIALDALIENAVEHTSEQALIEIVTRGADGALVVEVADTGPGIDPERLPHVFDRFARGDADRGRQNGGTGLGLAIVKAIAEAHGGSASIASDLGRGTTVQIRLPNFTERDVLSRSAGRGVAAAAATSTGSDRSARA
jgi:two-component system OmpR family sensor kinase